MTSTTHPSVAFPPELARILRAQGWRDVHLLERVDSTNAHAAAAAEPWSLVAAHEQFAGRGRLQRAWEVPPGSSVSLSVTVPLPHDAGTWGWVPLFVGSAVLETCEALCADGRFALKWPNDVLAQEGDDWRKISGVLCQVIAGATPLVVVGVGLNVSQERSQLPVPTATSLRLVGSDASRDEALVQLAQRLFALAGSWDDRARQETLRRAVRARCTTVDSDVVVHTPDGERVSVRATGIDDSGRLITAVPGALSDSPPRVVAYSVADVEHVRSA